MSRLLLEAQAHARSLSGYYANGYYNNSCYNRSGCLAGAIVGAVIFALIALALLVWLVLRLKRQRAAQEAYYNQPVPNNPQAYGTNAVPPYPGYAGNQPYPQQYGQQQYPQPGQGGGYPGGAPPTNMNDAQRAEWEAEQYAKYGEAGLVQGYPANPAGPSNGVQMSQIPPNK